MFLAEITLTRIKYMGDWTDRDTESTIFRLVQADSIEEAKRKVINAFERDDPYGTSVQVEVQIHPAL